MQNRKQTTCHADCYHFPHRMGSAECKFTKTGEYK
jgi:hypothetical protein